MPCVSVSSVKGIFSRSARLRTRCAQGPLPTGDDLLPKILVPDASDPGLEQVGDLLARHRLSSKGCVFPEFLFLHQRPLSSRGWRRSAQLGLDPAAPGLLHLQGKAHLQSRPEGDGVGASKLGVARCLAFACAAMSAALVPPRALDPQRHITQYGVQVWTTAQGLPSNAVNAVLQSRDGYLWLGTEDGLVRFDGDGVHLYDRSTVPAFKVSDVTALVETPSFVLYAATTGGVIRSQNGSFHALRARAGPGRGARLG